MGEEDIKRQAPNVYRIELLGAKVEPVTSGSKTLKDAVNESIRDWVTKYLKIQCILLEAQLVHTHTHQ